MGSPLVLSCAATAVPAVTWLKDGRTLGTHGGGDVPGFCPRPCLSFPISNSTVKKTQGPAGEEAEHEGVGTFPACF